MGSFAQMLLGHVPQLQSFSHTRDPDPFHATSAYHRGTQDESRTVPRLFLPQPQFPSYHTQTHDRGYVSPEHSPCLPWFREIQRSTCCALALGTSGERGLLGPPTTVIHSLGKQGTRTKSTLRALGDPKPHWPGLPSQKTVLHPSRHWTGPLARLGIFLGYIIYCFLSSPKRHANAEPLV